MILSGNLLPFLVKANESSSSTSGTLFTYDLNTGFQVSSKKYARIKYQLRCILYILVSFEYLYRVFSSLTKETTDLFMDSIQLNTNLCIMATAGTVLIAVRSSIRAEFPEAYLTYFNSILLSERKYEKDFQCRSMKKSKMAKQVLSKSDVVCRYLTAPPLALACAVSPKIPFNVIWIVDHLIFRDLQGPLLREILTFVSNYCFWQAIAIEAFRLTTDVIIGTISLTYCLQISQRKFSQELQGTEDNNHVTCSWDDTKHNLYRSVHILVTRYNDIMNILLFAVLFAHGVVQVMAVVTVLLCEPSEALIFLYLFLVLCIIQVTIIILVAYGFAGDVHEESTNSLKCLQKENRIRVGTIPRRKFRHTEKFLASCQVEKLQFGLSNFVEKATPLKFQQYCLDRIIDMALLSK